MEIKIHHARLQGEILAPASKSVLHRQCIAAALCSTPTKIRGVTYCADTLATIECLKALGADFATEGDTLTVTPLSAPKSGATLDCKESGSTLRFLLPVAAALGADATFTGCGRLPNRPIFPLLQALKSGGCQASSETLPLTLSGRVCGGDFTLPGDVSSQFVSGFLLAAPLMTEDCALSLSGKTESLPYIHLTIDTLRQFGVTVETYGQNVFKVTKDACYQSPAERACEGDWSNAAFWLVAGALGEGICCQNLHPDSAQGDKAIVEILRKFGAQVAVTQNAVTVRPAPLTACQIDATDIPDLVPVLAVLATAAKGTTKITGAARLRIKESDRLTAVTQMLENLGGQVRLLEDGLEIKGQPQLKGGQVSACNDHRIAMSAAIAALRCADTVTVTEAESVEKSYPDFWQEYARLGGEITCKGDL